MQQAFEGRMTRIEAQKAIDDLRVEAEDLPEMTIDEINAEIAAARAKLTNKQISS